MSSRLSLAAWVALLFAACAQTSSRVPSGPGLSSGEPSSGAASSPVDDARALFPALAGDGPLPVHHLPPADETQVVLGDHDYKQRRKAWIEERHRAPPDVDWRVLEAANGSAQRERRNALASLAAATGSRWTERGSDNQAGRMHVTVPSPDGSQIWAGSSLGGVWRGDPDGSDWTPLGDNLDGGAHWLAVVPGAGASDPDVILRATDGGKIHRSIDEGATWTVPTGLPSVSNVRRLATTTDGTHTIFLVVRKTNGGNELLRSTNGGSSFAQVAGLGTYEGDAWVRRDGGSDLYLLRNGNVWRSTDNGTSWVLRGSLPVLGGQGEITGSEAGAPRLWVVQDESGTLKLYRSDDAGVTWVQKATVSDYWGSLNASIGNANLFAWGGVELHKTTNGGDAFAIQSPWWEYYGNVANRLHADIPGIDVVADGQGGEIWYVNTDGGLFESRNGLASVSNLSLSGLRVSQYYDTHTSLVNPNNVVAGSQDQGYQRTGSPPVPPGTTLSFAQLISGDYGHLTSGDGSHAWLFSVYPGFVLVQRKENDVELYTTDFPPGENYSWLPFIRADPYLPQNFFFCATHLYKHVKGGGFSWTPTLWSTHDFEQSGGEYLTALAFSPLDAERAYAATNYGRLFWSNDHGVTWTQSATNGPGAHYFYGTAIVASGLDVDSVTMGGSGYGNPAVWRSSDGGATFQPWGEGLPSTLVYALAEAPDGSGRMFAGTETSAYARGSGDPAWVDIAQNDAPVTIYWSAAAVPSANAIRFGTYGRGIWDYSVDEPCAYEPYGVALGGTNVMTLDSASASNLGQTHVFTVAGGPSNAFGYVIVSAAPAALAAYGGTLLVDPNAWILLPALSDGAGGLTFPVPVPNDPSLADLTIYWQAALRTSLLPESWAFSNGLLGTLCAP